MYAFTVRFSWYNSTDGLVKTDYLSVTGGYKIRNWYECWHVYTAPEDAVKIYINIEGIDKGLWLDGLFFGEADREDLWYPYIVGTQNTTNAIVTLECNGLKQTFNIGTLSDGEEKSFQGEIPLAGLVKLNATISGSYVIEYTIHYTPVVKVENAIITGIINNIIHGIYYTTPIVEGNEVVILTTRTVNLKKAYWKGRGRVLETTLDTTNTDSTTIIYTANYGKPSLVKRRDTGTKLREVPTLSDLDRFTDCWYYDSENKLLYVKVRHYSEVTVVVDWGRAPIVKAKPFVKPVHPLERFLRDFHTVVRRLVEEFLRWLRSLLG